MNILSRTLPGANFMTASFIRASWRVSLAILFLTWGMHAMAAPNDKPVTSASNVVVTLDVYSGSLTMNSGTVLSLTAPTSGDTNGIALMEPSSNSSQITIQKGNVTGSLTGIIYAPSAQLYLQDSGDDTSGGISLVSDLIVKTLVDKTATLTVNSYSAANPTTTPLRAVALVE